MVTRNHLSLRPIARACGRVGILLVAVAGAVPACHADLMILPANQLPVADARILRDGQTYNARMDGGAAELRFDYSGSPVTVTLDGTQSSDPDGSIVAYEWLSATPVPEGGTQAPDATTMARLIPPGDPLNWPGNAAQPQIQLPQGTWSFSLWVTDNQGAVSKPDTITVTVGVDPVKQCADNVLSTEPPACAQCLCSQTGTQGDTCRAAVTTDKCDQSCWNLVNCVAANCPDFQAMAAKMPPDYSCLTANCTAYLSGSTGATPVAPCFNACTMQCMGVATSGDGGGGGGSDSGGGGG